MNVHRSLWCLVWGLLLADPSAAIDIGKFRLVQTERPNKPEEHTGYHVYDNALALDGLPGPIPLARSSRDGTLQAIEPQLAGFDPSTLKLRWLAPDRLLWVSWGTFPVGQGLYAKEGHLLLLFEGDRRAELFRDSIYAFGRSGIAVSLSRSLTFTFDAPHSLVTLTRAEINRDESAEEESGSSESTGDTPPTEVQVRTVWVYRLEDTALRLVSGETFADIKSTASLNYLATAFSLSPARLMELNPRLKGARHADGAVRVSDSVPPYRYEHDDGLCGSIPCPASNDGGAR